MENHILRDSDKEIALRNAGLKRISRILLIIEITILLTCLTAMFRML